jgi:tRNA A-37 threonylcarbamoyl transferase component Bud32
MAKSQDIRLGQHLIQRRLCNLKQVNEGLAVQKELRGQGQMRPLGWILVQKKYLDEEQLRGALADLGALELHCPACRETHGIISYETGKEYRCPRCRTPLVLEETIAPEGAPMAPAPAKTVPAPAPEADGSDAMIQKVIGGCQILERIARGGMGVVYKARQLNLGRTVAIKILSEDLSKDRTYVERFLQEARSAAGLSHGNIIHINDVGEYNGIFYFSMEHVDGENIREILLRQGTLDIRQALLIALQVSQALQHAHRRGIIHRDIKPENIMITREGAVKLADLGLAKMVDKGGGITHAGSILGTPFYMAPEQAKDFSQVDQRSDIYSLGVTLYKALSGKVPYDGRSPLEVMIKAIDGKRQPIRDIRPEIPPEVEALVDRMMDREPDRRFQEASQVITALEAILSGPPPAGTGALVAASAPGAADPGDGNIG